MIQLPYVAIDFEQEQHLYTLHGFRIPSVTQIMEPLSLMLYNSIPLDVLNEAADRGSRAHEQISNYVKYGVEEPDEDTEPYFEAFKKFEREYKPAWVESEYRTYHKILRYAGTIDLIGYIEPDDGTGVDVIDLKCTSVYHRLCWQHSSPAIAKHSKATVSRSGTGTVCSFSRRKNTGSSRWRTATRRSCTVWQSTTQWLPKGSREQKEAIRNGGTGYGQRSEAGQSLTGKPA